MILTASRLFDYAAVAKNKAAEELKPFIDYCNTNFEKIIRAVAGELTLTDNIKGQMLATTFQHGIAQSVAVASTAINGVVPMSCDDDAITAVKWALNINGGLQLTVYFQSASATKRNCNLFVFFK